MEEYCLGLFEATVRNIPELKITYNDRPVGDDLVLLKGYLVNTGWKDITPEMVGQHLALDLPTGYRWLKAVASSPHTEVSVGLANQ